MLVISTRKLQDLRASANSAWKDSAIWPLASSYLTFLDSEIKLRKEVNESLLARPDFMPRTMAPNEPDKHEDSSPDGLYGMLHSSYNAYSHCYEKIRKKESITSLQSWYQQSKIQKWIKDMPPSAVEAYIFPKVDRDYRESVRNQRHCASAATKWHTNTLPLYLEAHQQYAEDAKSMLDTVVKQYSHLSSSLVQLLADMMKKGADFSSSRYIAPLHQYQEEEASHSLMKPVVYCNFYTDGKPAQPIFGLKVSISYCESNYKTLSPAGFDTPMSITKAFEMERNAKEDSGIQGLLEENMALAQSSIVLAFLSVPCLVSLPKDSPLRNNEKWTRHRIASMMKTMSPESKLHMERWLAMRLHLSYPSMAALWCHNPLASHVVESICRKWDFERDVPLPDGVERTQWRFRQPLVNKKTQEPYEHPP